MAGVHVQWLDNFSKFYAVAVQGLGTGAFTDCLWTAAGLHRYVGPVVSTSLQPGVPGMPSSLVSPTVISLFKQKMAVADAVSEGFLKDSGVLPLHRPATSPEAGGGRDDVTCSCCCAA